MEDDEPEDPEFEKYLRGLHCAQVSFDQLARWHYDDKKAAKDTRPHACVLCSLDISEKDVALITGSHWHQRCYNKFRRWLGFVPLGEWKP